MKGLFTVAACVSIVAVFIICIFMFANGLPAIMEIGPLNFLTGIEWRPNNDIYGILPMIVGSVLTTIGALIIGAPIGILSAVFLAFYCPKKIYPVLKSGVQLLAGIPSVVYGFFGLMVLVPFVREVFGGRGLSVLTASVLLGMMILPTIISVSESSIRAVNTSYYEGSVGLGRAIGETMAVIMVAGNQAAIPKALTDGVRTMTTNIVMEMGYAVDLHRQALIGTAVVLFIFILIINFLLAILKRGDQQND